MYKSKAYSAASATSPLVTDTIPLTPEAQLSPRIRQLSVADVLAETIRRISNEDSVSSLFIE